MTSPQSNPRRCYKTGAHPASASFQVANPNHARHTSPVVDTDRSLRKSSTFHSPKSPASEDDPILHINLLSRRSPTSPKELEDAVAAGERRNRISHLLGVVDRSLSGLETFSTDSDDTIHASDLPVPRFMVNTHTTDPSHMDIDDTVDDTTPSKPQHHHNRHASDSGIGSSVTGSEASLSRDDAAYSLAEYKTSIPSLINEIQSGINGTSSVAGQAGPHVLSAYACRQIQKYIIVPILNKESLKAFHPLITGIPLRVRRKEVTCLRDLEKVLLWLAPVSESYHVWARSLAHMFGLGVQRFSVSRSSFIKFCETSIQCLHTTVEHLNEPDLQRPSDRPYTNGYFLDLTEQVRQYAAMITAARERRAAEGVKEECNDLEETLTLRGGLSQTGRPAELVTTSKDGQTVSLRTGEKLGPEASPIGMKRSASQEAEEDYLLSMARRRKAAAVKEVQRCSECDKEFKRPCDLTKHEKTHSRPWKCDDPSCKYAQYGWPTEKERDRHVNDKHSVTPSMYKCQFHPCPYESKRESNCKQHMEKAHGWAYVRSKNNGKSGRKAKATSKASSTPQTTPGSYIFEASGSEFGDTSSPYVRGSSGAPTAFGSLEGTSPSPYLGMSETFAPSPFEPNFAWPHPNPRLTPQSPYTPASHRPSLDSSYLPNAHTANLHSSYQQSHDLDPPLFDDTFDWSNMDLNVQLLTPANSAESRPLDAFHSRNPSISFDQPQQTLKSENPNLSPGAVGGLMLYSPHENTVVDEGYDEFVTGKPTGDFPLYDSIPASGMDTASLSLFSDLPPFNSNTWSAGYGDFMEE